MLWLHQEVVKTVRIAEQSNCVLFATRLCCHTLSESLLDDFLRQYNVFVWFKKGMLSGKYLKA